jgi:lysostaphin
MKPVTPNRFLTFGAIGLVSAVAVAWANSSVLTQPAANSVTHAQSYSSEPSSSSYIWPTQGTLSQRFHTFHEGLDIAGPTGTPIVAAKAGEVMTAGWDDWGLGKAITLQHADGTRTVYGHNSRLLVSEGQQVQQGQIIAEMGSTGNSTGPHLHFEVHPKEGDAVNPFPLLPSLVAGKIPPLQPVAAAPDSSPATQNPTARPNRLENSRGTTPDPLNFDPSSQERQPNRSVAILPPPQSGKAPTEQIEPSAPESTAGQPIMVDGVCGETTVLEGETPNFLISVCSERGQLFYFGQSKQNPNVTVWLPARRVSGGRYRAENGSYSYLVGNSRVEVLRNGRQIRSERFNLRDS